MTAIPPPAPTIANMIDAAHEAASERPRPHMGCSLLGHACDRFLWLTFRWAVASEFPGRILRVFRRGQNEEAIIVADLRRIGIDIRQTGTSQSRVNLGCHVSGSIDGVIEKGVPEAPAKRHVAEFKTHSLKSFNALEKDGVMESKPRHWAQVQLYMHGTKIDRALYLAVCKDDDRIYTERIRYDKSAAENLIARGHRLALAERMPEPLSADPTWYACKYCNCHDLCHVSKMTKEVNCRTCAHVTPMPDGTWRCAYHDADGIPVDYQRTGCESHVLHPDLVPWKRLDSSDQWTALYEHDGHQFNNGTPDANCFASKELIANLKACVHQDQFVQDVRVDMGARIDVETDDIPF